MKRSILAVCLVTTAVGCAPPRLVAPLRYESFVVAPDDAPRQAPAPVAVNDLFDDAPTVTTLGSGLRVVVVERHEFPVLAAYLVVDRGTLDLDDAGGQKVTQMVFAFGGGGDDATTEKVTRAAAESGVRVSTGSGARTWAAVSSPSASLDEAMNALAAIVYGTKLTHDEYNRRAGLWDEAVNVAGRSLLMAERRMLFGDMHPYGYRHPGHRFLPLGEVQDLHDRLFQPAQATLAIVGDVSRERVAASVARAFDAWRGGTPLPSKSPSPPPREAPRVSVVRAQDLSQTLVAVFARGPELDTEPSLAFTMLGQILGGTTSSRLSEHLRQETGDAFATGATVYGDRPASWMSIHSSFTPDKAIDGVAAILAAIRAEQNDSLPDIDAQIAVARETLISQWRSSMSSVSGAAAQYALWALGGDNSDPRTYPARLAKVGRKDIARVADESFGHGGLRVVIMGEDRWLDVEQLGLGRGELLDLFK